MMLGEGTLSVRGEVAKGKVGQAFLPAVADRNVRPTPNASERLHGQGHRQYFDFDFADVVFGSAEELAVDVNGERGP